ncbi:LysR family transcriptional regulator substrate-binding protein [Rarobacter incanus]|uniref:LysR family transcriptional regulator substrate-binding protein n=1 Tax=Rarobacter incanus TaxID=153494 RepID=UPI001476EF2E|nr:LysR family transcriptional regulator substrate-binding protein [Rarobacter incanus]
MTPGKWQRVWRELVPATPLSASLESQERAVGGLSAGEFNAALVRVPVPGDQWHTITLYEEATVVVAPVDHALTVLDECVLADLSDDVVLTPPDTGLVWGESTIRGRRPLLDVPTVKDAIEWCAASAGLLVVPMSLARLYHRKDVAHLPVIDAPTSSVGLVWSRRAAHPLCDDLAGIVRGRGARSSRGDAGRANGGNADRGRTDGGQADGGQQPRKGGQRAEGTGGGRGESARGGSARGTGRGSAGGRRAGGSRSRGKGTSGRR